MTKRKINVKNIEIVLFERNTKKQRTVLGLLKTDGKVGCGGGILTGGEPYSNITVMDKNN